MANEHALTVWRKSQNLTQDDLAGKLGVSRWMVNRLEVGERTPSFDLAIKIQEISKDAVKPIDFAKREPAE
ncbi:MAG: helix-turn-helix transcriptional regulator [Proteobacteria bacterium]|uniref:helix-turn-helix transcriptional regulator n=1 Tax=Agrobacterium TaxID=357 RepID=UPI000D1BE2DA|nr:MULTISPECIES: helix-turn-helix transcriptional regulator [Agrobacterium]MBS0257230.1 helix-turn-helix transcriptional regulator [Pseudomonadota bacterium]MCZ7502004.1 helix-turn-helix transcriptional regulator [Rhizobium rhizogenes]